jgi:hypothetical protein
MQNIDGYPKTHKTMKSAKYCQLDTVMYQRFIQARSQEIPLSGPVIMAKAVEMNKKLDGDPNCKASIGCGYLVSGLYPSSSVQKNKSDKNTTFRRLDLSPSSGG